jgi:hypothetical protein
MKVRLFLFAAAAFALLMGGCTTPSLNALATDETTVTDDELVGTWVDVNKDDSATYVVTDAGKSTYHLKCMPKEAGKHPLEFSFLICKLADTRFIDLTVTKADGEALGNKYGTTVVPAHAFMKIKRTRDELKVWQVKDEWLKDGLKSGEIKLAHAAVTKPGEEDGTYVLTGPTAELQRFFRQNAESEELFDKEMTFQRDTGEKPKAAETKKDTAK